MVGKQRTQWVWVWLVMTLVSAKAQGKENEILN